MSFKKISLGTLNLPGDLKKMSAEQCRVLCRDIRRLIIETVMKNGGHLSSNLGAVELTVALHKVFCAPDDKIIWDVGHQSYSHKLLTGRFKDFTALRKKDGISGFIRPSESVYDTFISGHSSTSISAALGMAEAMKLNGDKIHKAVAVIGDGSLTGGLAYEGLNNAGKSDNNIVIILNHNDMSISKNVGALAKYLTAVRGSQTYLNTKKTVENVLNKTPVIGEPLKNILGASKSALKTFLYHTTMFEDLGFLYLGPVDGHNLNELEDAFNIAKRVSKPVFIHVNTVKGKGFKPAERNPGAFHSVPSGGFDKNNPLNIPADCYSEYFGRKLTGLASENPEICAVTAAMKYATGLHYFASAYPDRFYDVGIAEQHAVTFSAALAKSGKIPVLAVYSSFLQRAYDQIIHDAAIDGLHIVLAVDRAGIVGEDGETHQGIYDIPMLRTIPNTCIYSPSTAKELSLCLETAVYKDSKISCVRYPRGSENTSVLNTDITDSYSYSGRGNEVLAVCYGRVANNVYEAYDPKAVEFDILKLVKVFPLQNDIISICMKYNKIVIFEECFRQGGIGEYLLSVLALNGYKGKFKINAIDGFVKQASVQESLAYYKLNSDSIKNIISDLIKIKQEIL